MKKLLSAAALLLTLAFAGGAYAHMHEGAEGDTPGFMDKAISKLPPQKAKEFRDTMKEAHEENKELFEKMHQVHQELHDILVAPKFDQDAFLDKSKEMRDLRDQMEANLNESFTTAVSKLNQHERIGLAHDLHEGMMHGQQGQKGHWHHGTHTAKGSDSSTSNMNQPVPVPQHENGPTDNDNQQ